MKKNLALLAYEILVLAERHGLHLAVAEAGAGTVVPRSREWALDEAVEAAEIIELPAYEVKLVCENGAQSVGGIVWSDRAYANRFKPGRTELEEVLLQQFLETGENEDVSVNRVGLALGGPGVVMAKREVGRGYLVETHPLPCGHKPEFLVLENPIGKVGVCWVCDLLARPMKHGLELTYVGVQQGLRRFLSENVKKLQLVRDLKGFGSLHRSTFCQKLWLARTGHFDVWLTNEAVVAAFWNEIEAAAAKSQITPEIKFVTPVGLEQGELKFDLGSSGFSLHKKPPAAPGESMFRDGFGGRLS